MSIRFQCECGKKLKATDDKIGKRVLCPDCGQPVSVPSKNRMLVEAIDVAADGGKPVQDSAQTARELLKLSTAASREALDAGKPSDEPARKRGEEATVTLGEYLRHNGKQYGLPAVGVVAACFVLYALSNWMLGSKLRYPDLYPVSGTITLDDKPLAGADVTFRSQSALMSDEPIGASVGRTDSQGRYTLEYVAGVRGAVAGKHFVEISHTGPDGLETLPAKFHSQTKLEIEVQPDKENGYDLALESQ